MIWEKVNNEYRLVFDGKLTGYVIVEITIDNYFTVKKNGKELVGLEMSLGKAKMWCERHSKLDMLE